MERGRLERVRAGARTIASGDGRDRLAHRPRAEEAGRRAAAYEAAHEIAGTLGGEADLDAVLACVAERARAHAGARAAALGLVEGGDVVVRARAGQAEYRDDGALLVPVVLGGRVIGVLAVFDRLHDGPAFDAEDERRLEAFALGAAPVVAIARSVATDGVRRTLQGAEDERRRWARELHDETLQDLGALRVLLGGARQGGDASGLQSAVDTALARLSEQAGALRALIADLHPQILERFGVRAAIEELVARVRARHGLEIGLDVALDDHGGRGARDGDGGAPRRLAAETELAIYRTVQEALTNVVRHAQASRAEVEIRERGGDVVVRVSDDGRGFAARSGSRGFGLAGMRERVRLVHGRLTVRSRQGRGTTVRAVIPVAALAAG